MSLLDFFTGGKSSDASDAMRRAEDIYGGIQTPTVAQLTLPELQKYVEAGVMTPAEAQAYLQQNNALADQNIDQTGTAAEVTALNKLSQVANAGAEGTPMAQAQEENAIQKMNTSVGGQRGAIEQGMEARGTPASLVQAALANQTVGQEGQMAHNDAVNAQAANYQAALAALSQGGGLGGQLQGQQNTQANTVANAANAMQEFNAANQQRVSEANTGRRQEANAANFQNRQDISNKNTGLGNARTMYNANLPEVVFGNQMQKAGGQAGAAQASGDLANKQGGQNAGIISGLINIGTSFIPKPGGAAKPPPGYNPNMTEDMLPGGAHGGIVCMDDGGMVPGDSPANDTVHAMLSPGEAVIPRSEVSQNPDVVAGLLGDQDQGTQIDFRDVAALLKAMRSIRLGVA